MEWLNNGPTKTIIQPMLLFSWLARNFAKRKDWSFCFVFFFLLLPALCLQTTCRALLLGRGPHLPCSPGTSTSLDKHFIGFDACLRALMYLKCSLRSAECSCGLVPFPPGSSLLRHCWLYQYLLILFDILCVCVCSSSKEDLLKSSDFLPMCCVKY